MPAGASGDGPVEGGAVEGGGRAEEGGDLVPRLAAAGRPLTLLPGLPGACN